MYLDVKSPVIRYIVHNEIRQRFPDVLTTDSLGNSNKVNFNIKLCSKAFIVL